MVNTPALNNHMGDRKRQFECNALWDTVEMQYAQFNTAHFRGSLRVVCFSKNGLNLNRTLKMKGELKNQACFS